MPGGESLAGIERRIEEINQETKEIVVKAAQEGSCARYADKLKMLLDETTNLKEKQAFIEKQRKNHSEAAQRIKNAADMMKQSPEKIVEWDESLIRQMVDTVKVVSAEKINVYLRGGVEIQKEIVK